MTFQRKLSIASALFAAVVLPAHAEGLYAGGALGESHLKSPDSALGVSDHSATAFKLYGGYSFTPNFSLETGYADLGRFAGTSGDTKAHALFLDGVGTLPLGNGFSALGRLGVYDAKLRNATLGSQSTTGLKLGAGVQYDLSKAMALRGEWERYRMNDFGSAKAKADLYTVGLNYRF
jgi:OOP family OmpA-OmpF porin